MSILQILVSETPDPSPDLVAMWAQLSSLPHLTVEDANRFVKYNQARSRNDHIAPFRPPSMLKTTPPREDVEMEHATQSDEENMSQEDRGSFDHTHLPTPESTSPEPDIRTLKPDPCLSPTIPLPHNRLHSDPPPAPLQVPPDARALLQMLRTQLSPAEFHQLMHEGTSDASGTSTLTPRTRTSSNMARASSASDSRLPSPTSPTFPHQRLTHRPPNSTYLMNNISSFPASSVTSAPISVPSTKLTAPAVTGLGTSFQPHALSSSPRLTRPTITSASTPGILPRNVLDELAEIFHNTASAKSIAPDQSAGLLEPCQEKSDRFLVALERGDLRVFGLLPSNELQGLRLEDKERSSFSLGDVGEPPEPP
jgi:hypothetical protein